MNRLQQVPDQTTEVVTVGKVMMLHQLAIAAGDDDHTVARGHAEVGRMGVWEFPFTQLRLPKLFNLRSDPFERADQEGMDYQRWRAEHLFVLVPAQEYVGAFLATFREFPPSQKVGSFSLDNVLESLQQSANK